MHIFSCFSAVYFFSLTFPSSWRKFVQCVYIINQGKIILYKDTIKWNWLGIVHDYCDCHKTRNFTITRKCSQRLCEKIIQISYHLESNICIPLLSNDPIKRKETKITFLLKNVIKKKKKMLRPDLNRGTFDHKSWMTSFGITNEIKSNKSFLKH